MPERSTSATGRRSRATQTKRASNNDLGRRSLAASGSTRGQAEDIKALTAALETHFVA